ncbi:MAG: NAD(P)/FAD-dependent oxidoreductase [Myxococcota bacterium]
MNRRALLASLGATLSTVPLAPGAWAGPADLEQVVIVGAGVAGLTVANLLGGAGVACVVLEARDRLGGRVWTRDVGGVPVDLGGMWVSGTRGSPTAALLRHLGHRVRSAPLFTLRTPLVDAVTNSRVGAFGKARLAKRLSGFRPDEHPASWSLEDAIQHHLDAKGLGGDLRRRVEFALRTQIELGFGLPADALSSRADSVTQAFPGGEHLPESTYAPLVAALAEGVEVRRSTEVRAIEHGPKGVLVRTSTGEFEGTHVVVTVPLGVLKAGRITFTPPLPAEKQAAVDRLVMGRLEKVALRFPDGFAPGRGRGNALFLGSRTGDFPLLVDESDRAGHPLWLGLVAADRVPRAERIASMRAALEHLSGQPTPEPVEAIATDWTHDPHAQGAYMVLPPGAGEADVVALGKPVGERLRFAGEATSPRYSGYVHGAMLSGVREAEALLGRTPLALRNGLTLTTKG